VLIADDAALGIDAAGPPELPDEMPASVWMTAVEGALVGDDRAVERRHDAEGDVGSPSRSRANRSPAPPPRADVRRRRERHGRNPGAVDVQQGEVVAGVGRTTVASIGSVSPPAATWIVVGAVDDVGVGEHLAVGGHDHAGADGAAELGRPS
jgi:hypothetical protein